VKNRLEILKGLGFMSQHFMPSIKTPLWVSLAFPINLVIALALALISFLNYYVFEKTYKDLNVSRITVVGRDLRQVIESGLNIGLSPESNIQFSQSLHLAKDLTEGINFIIVIDDKGRRLLQVGEGQQNPDWAKKSGYSSWTSEDKQTYQIGLPYRNSFGIVEGTIILGYDRNSIVAATNDMRLALIRDWVYDIIIVFIVTLCGIFLLVRKLNRELTLIESDIKRPLNDTDHHVYELSVLGPDFKSGLSSFMKHSREVAADLKDRHGDHSL